MEIEGCSGFLWRVVALDSFVLYYSTRRGMGAIYFCVSRMDFELDWVVLRLVLVTVLGVMICLGRVG